MSQTENNKIRSPGAPGRLLSPGFGAHYGNNKKYKFLKQGAISNRPPKPHSISATIVLQKQAPRPRQPGRVQPHGTASSAQTAGSWKASIPGTSRRRGNCLICHIEKL